MPALKALQGRSVFMQQGDGPENKGRLSCDVCKGQSRDSKDIAKKCKELK